MKKHSFERFNANISWNTKFFVLLAFVTVVISFGLGGSSEAIVFGSLVALSLVLIVEYFKVFSIRHPKAWKVVKIILIGLIMMLSLLSTIG
jgi:hypothetical protein